MARYSRVSLRRLALPNVQPTPMTDSHGTSRAVESPAAGHVHTTLWAAGCDWSMCTFCACRRLPAVCTYSYSPADRFSRCCTRPWSMGQGPATAIAAPSECHVLSRHACTMQEQHIGPINGNTAMRVGAVPHWTLIATYVHLSQQVDVLLLTLLAHTNMYFKGDENANYPRLCHLGVCHVHQPAEFWKNVGTTDSNVTPHIMIGSQCPSHADDSQQKQTL